jgi:hypothetical protein
MLRFLKAGIGMIFLRAVFTFAIPPLVLAHEAHHSPPPDTAALPDEAAFLRENAAAMTKMMEGMAAKPTGDIDRDFVAMMAPHHQGAIDMAVIELRYGKNEQLRRIAQEIIVDQQQEIAAMRLALGQPLPPSVPAPTQFSLSNQSALPDMPTDVHAHNHAGIRLHAGATTNATEVGRTSQ